ncbi:MAG: fimbrillin family protein [Bacteroidales bacterium]|nr:fimbrillin family protein [Bacteroidales bacterium]
MRKETVYIILSAICITASCGKDKNVNETDPMLTFDSAALVPEEGIHESTKSTVTDSASLKTNGNTIGIYGSYTYGSTTYQVFDSEPQILTYSASDNAWSYSPLAKWNLTAHYTFRAYFPSAASVQSESSADMLAIDYKTTTEQYDLLVAYTTRYPAGDAEGTSTVNLPFRHALSGLRFTIKLKNTIPAGTTDAITNLYVKNIYPVGTLVFGKDEDSQKQDSLKWMTSYFSSYNKYYQWTGEKTFGVDGQPGAEQTVFDGDGLVFVIPQTLSGATVNFTTRNSTSVYSAPLYNGVSTWQPGKIYTYNLTISGSAIKVDVSIMDWSELKSNVDIYL